MSPPKQSSLPTEDIIPGQFGPHPPSMIKKDDLIGVRFLCGLPSETKILAPTREQSPEDPPEGYCCAYEIMFSNCGLYFPLPELLVKAMYALGVALPQLCPNFIRTVLSLQTLAEEHGYLLTFQDILHLYTIKGGRTRGTFYLSPLAGLRVLEDLPEKDEDWRSGYFFPVDSSTFCELTDLFVPKWSSKNASLDRGSLSRTFANCFISFCGSQVTWDSFTSHRIRESGARIRTGSLITSSPQPVLPRNVNYHEERAYKKQAELREKELKKQMVTALAEGKSKTPAKEKNSGSTAPPEARTRILVAVDTTYHLLRNLYCYFFLSRVTNYRTVSAPPKSLADMMRSFSRPGARVPPFKEMADLNRENYFRFAEKVGETLIEFNSAVASYEHQLLSNPDASDIKGMQSQISELEKRVKRLTAAEAANQLEVEKAKKSNARLKLIESELRIAEASLEDSRDKQQKARELYLQAVEAEALAKREVEELRLRNHAMEIGFNAEIKRACREERRKTRAQLREAAEGVHAFLDDHNRLVPATIRAAEITANRMLVEEIESGEIADLKAELETLKKDELEALQTAKEDVVRVWPGATDGMPVLPAIEGTEPNAAEATGVDDPPPSSEAGDLN
ncbi:uncharacterized protein At3g60930, chloroplastic-like [Capsella rubella]|uniref:uncharacterized protein At3g60930, chloroplastic-like n=1 Tax=Capsella rubella TaxID=81985 RepID=UPI000CD5C258|nr:uncharacterized protein At3g60930, chloroplastic-like [Capsella rubella]